MSKETSRQHRGPEVAEWIADIRTEGVDRTNARGETKMGAREQRSRVAEVIQTIQDYFLDYFTEHGKSDGAEFRRVRFWMKSICKTFHDRGK